MLRLSTARTRLVRSSAHFLVKMLGLDRQKMEQERLARLSSKRQLEHRPDIPAQSDGASKRQRVNPDSSETTPSVSSRPVLTDSETVQQTVSNGPVAVRLAKTSPRELKFPKPTVLRTFSEFHERKRDITFEELVDRKELRTAVFSSFQWDMDWLFARVDMGRTKMVFVMAAYSEEQKQEYRDDLIRQGLIRNIRLCFPYLRPKGHSIMHSKLMLLFYESHLRIVVPTGNLVPYDWGYPGFIENAVFAIDLPRRIDGSKTPLDELTAFGGQLRQYLELMNMENNVLDGMLNFDYSATANIGFVFSVCQQPESICPPSGTESLSKVIEQMKLTTELATTQLSYATASLGLLDKTLLARFLAAATGREPNSVTSPASYCKVYYPTKRSVEASLGGPDSAGTICAQKMLYLKPAFEKSVLRDFNSSRAGMLSHSKLLFVRGLSEDGGRRWLSWMYIGSANMTVSAWGSILGKEKRFVCKNWECGVVIPGQSKDRGFIGDQDEIRTKTNISITKASSTDKKEPMQETSAPSLKYCFESIMDVPMRDEDKRYASDDEPWFFNS